MFVCAGAVILLSMPCVLGFNVLSGIQPLGEGTTIMDLEDFIVSNNLLPLGSLGYVLFCTRKNGWGWANFLEEANTGKGIRFPGWLEGYMSYVLPLIITVIYLKGYYDKFCGPGNRGAHRMDDRGRALPWIYHSVRGGAQAGSVKLWLLLGLPDKARPFFGRAKDCRNISGPQK